MDMQLILLRHGQSAWNKKNLFTGWVDIPLSEEGIQECFDVGERLADTPIDCIYTSSLVRAHMTVMLVMVKHRSGKVPVFKHPGQGHLETWGEIYSQEAETNTIPVYSAWELNERMYGRLQGLNKAETAAQYGEQQVQRWRRGFGDIPPEGESLQMTAERTLPYFHQHIVPAVRRGERVLVSAHGNSLRAIVMDLEGLSGEEVAQLELPTGVPRGYGYEQGTWVRNHSF